MIWLGRTISTKFASRFEKVDTQVDAELERMRINASKPQLQLGEIILVPGPSRTIEQTLELAGEMVAAILQRGQILPKLRANIRRVAAPRGGGDIGWIIVDKLAAPFREALADVENGDVSAPVLVDGTVYIFRRIAERKDGLADASQSRVWLARALLPLDADASEADQAGTCSSFTARHGRCNKLWRYAGTERKLWHRRGKLDNILIADLAPQMRKLLLSLTPEKPSEPLAFAEGVVTLMLCRVEMPQQQLPARYEIRQILIDRAFGSLAERQLLRERRTALIEYPGQS